MLAVPIGVGSAREECRLFGFRNAKEIKAKC